MPERRRPAAAGMLLWLSLAVCWPSVFAATQYDDLLVQITTPTGGESSVGYLEYQATISNAGRVPHTVELMIPQLRMGGYGHHIRQMSRTVTVPADSAVSVSLFQPPLPIYGNMASVTIDGRLQRDLLRLPSISHGRYYYKGGVNFCVLLSRRIGFDEVNQGLQKAGAQDPAGMGMPMRSYSSSGMSIPGNLALADLPVSEWSRNWLSYSRYSGIILTGQEWTAAPMGVKRALMEYLRCGGCLSVIGQAESIHDLNPAGFEPSAAGRFDVYHPGFGVLLTTPRENLQNWLPADWDTLRQYWMNASRSLSDARSIREANDWFPVVDDLSIPVRGLLLIVLVFTILMGPANLFILSRKKKQIWLLWTVPLLSLTASAIVFGYSALAEGWKGQSRIQSLTILDENQNLATTIGIAAFYCPLTPRDGLHFDYETECTLQVGRDMYRHSGSSSIGREIDWTQDQHLVSGWVAARVPAHFKVRKSQMRREKLLFSELTPQHAYALNGFGVPIEKLVFANAEGTLFVAEKIQPGAKVRMERMDVLPSVTQSALHFPRDFFNTDWHHAMNEIIKEPAGYLKPNCYIAIVRQPLFIEQALQRQKSEVFESIVYGISQEQADAG